MPAGRQINLEDGVQQVMEDLRKMQAENNDFFLAIQKDNENCVENIFWADNSSRMNYCYFGDAVVFDSVHKSRGYKLPFVSFTGLNHHEQPVLFGCALLPNESHAAYVWLLQTWLQAMKAGPPSSITTAPDCFIQAVISQVFPETPIRFCKKGVLRSVQERFSLMFQSNPTFEMELKMCVSESETTDEFEESWKSLMRKHFIEDDEGLQSMYNARAKWVPAYFKNTFFGKEEGKMNMFFDGYVSESTTTQTLLSQYEKAVSSWHEKESQADFDTINAIPLLKTPSPLEKQAAAIYTKQIFLKFQDELMKTLAYSATRINDSETEATYRVEKCGKNERKPRIVSYDLQSTKASCSCRMFEFSGIICRHILAVLKARNVPTLPSQFILKRWTRNARSNSAANLETYQESLRSSLREEALKYAEEGAKSIHAYHTAMRALRDATKKVEAASLAAQGDASSAGESVPNSQLLKEEKEERIRKLSAELERLNERCEIYRANLFSVLRDMEDQKLKLSVMVQNARLTLKE